MIYRIEFTRDGAIASCAEVEANLTDGRLVVYIQADSKESAISLAKTKWKQWRETHTQKRKIQGMCTSCLCRAPSVGKSTCDECIRKRTQRKRAHRLSLVHGVDQEREAQSVAAQRAGSAVGIAAAALASLKKSDELWDRFEMPRTDYVKSVLRQVARAYDRDPERFREWLTKVLELVNDRENTEPRATAESVV